MQELEPESIDLVVTSPPYPMIEMWDGLFTSLDPQIGVELSGGDGPSAFALMHEQLNEVWARVLEVMKEGAIACINIGDATRNLGNDFRLYPSHSVISGFFRASGMQELPSIIWKKPSNSPNKFLGSGTMPVGAYVTLEHEYILIFRKPGKRDFSEDTERANRRESSFFWEERNIWFSDIWSELRGVRQSMPEAAARERSAAFPFSVPYRLINMYSVKGDTVLDPFAGTGTTAMAAAASQRNSYGYEISGELSALALNRLSGSSDLLRSVVDERLSDHAAFVKDETARGKVFTHSNAIHGFPVKTMPEESLHLRKVQSIRQGSDRYCLEAVYE